MKHVTRIGMLAAVAVCAVSLGRADAAVADHVFFSNAVNYCQAFTPGPANTIRNRVIGSENVGEVPIAVACNFHSLRNGAVSTQNIRRIEFGFTNLNTSGTASVTCTLLAGYQNFVSYTVAKTTPQMVANGGKEYLMWTEADNPSSGAPDLGNTIVGINCTLPPGVLMGENLVTWRMDNGV
jgi:hypothetical protein